MHSAAVDPTPPVLLAFLAPSHVLLLQALQELRLTGCDIQQLPPSLRGLTSLKTLVLSGNQLAALPAEVTALTLLESLDCSLNHIERVEHLPRALKRLNLQVGAKGRGRSTAVLHRHFSFAAFDGGVAYRTIHSSVWQRLIVVSGCCFHLACFCKA